MNEATTILIVDDEPAGRETLAALLRPQLYHLRLAASGQEALAYARAEPPDLVLLDVMMPGMDGFEVCRQLRADPHLAEVPILMVTALDDRESRLSGLEAGADDFISKPFDRMELRTRIRVITRLNRYRRLLVERERFAHVFGLAPDGLLIVDAEGAILLANPAAVELVQAREPATLIGRAFAELVTPGHYAACVERLGAQGGGPVRLETILVTDAGQRLPTELTVSLMEWHGGPAAQISLRDISDRKRIQLLEEESRQLAFELHDGLAQVVTSVHLHLQAFAGHYRPRSPRARSELEQSLELARSAVSEVRRVIAGLRPTVLDDFGLAIALELHVASLRSEGWEVTYCDGLGEERLPPALETVLFRIAIEALTNVRKHARSTRVDLSLGRGEQSVRLTVQDWGQGFVTAELREYRGPGEGIGLRGIRERVALLGGECQILSAPGEGTTIVVEVPLPHA